MSAVPGENEARSAESRFPRLALFGAFTFMPDNRRPLELEAAGALDLIDELQAENAALRAACVVAQEDADRLGALFRVRKVGNHTIYSLAEDINIAAAVAAHVSAVASREVTT